MRRHVVAAGAAVLALGGVLVGGASAQAAPSTVTACPSSGGDSIGFSGKFYQRNATNGPLSIHLESGYNPANGKQYAWTFVQGASRGDTAWVDYTTGGSYTACGTTSVTAAGSFYTTSFLTSASSSVHMKACAKDVSTGTSVCTTAW